MARDLLRSELVSVDWQTANLGAKLVNREAGVARGWRDRVASARGTRGASAERVACTSLSRVIPITNVMGRLPKSSSSVAASALPAGGLCAPSTIVVG